MLGEGWTENEQHKVFQFHLKLCIDAGSLLKNNKGKSMKELAGNDACLELVLTFFTTGEYNMVEPLGKMMTNDTRIR